MGSRFSTLGCGPNVMAWGYGSKVMTQGFEPGVEVAGFRFRVSDYELRVSEVKLKV